MNTFTCFLYVKYTSLADMQSIIKTIQLIQEIQKGKSFKVRRSSSGLWLMATTTAGVRVEATTRAA